ncbi:MAG: antibiotic biosynthesis monooxygenase [bacterium]
MTEQAMAPFEVHADKIEEAKAAIREFIGNVRAKEPGTLLYTSLQHKDNPAKFVHFMIFESGDAHRHHRSTPYVDDFVKKLHPLCAEEPAPVLLEHFDSAGAAAESLARAAKEAAPADDSSDFIARNVLSAPEKFRG